MQEATTGATSVTEQSNMATATRFIEGFNNDDWDAVREVVAPGFVFHHPLGGTVEAGPEGMVATWAGFKVLSHAPIESRDRRTARPLKREGQLNG